MLGNRFYQRLLLKAGLGQAGLAVVLAAYPALAQSLVVPDRTLGVESSVVTDIDAVTQRIDGGASRGGNLFHSFSEFHIDEGKQVYFTTPGDILSIFSRITGQNPSAINGTLGVDGIANLFLMNPNGVMFGPNAQLDIEGSLTATTAENFIFDNGQMFGVTTPEIPSLLTVSVVPGLQYGKQSASITNQGAIQVGQDLKLGAQLLSLAGELEAGRDIVLQGSTRQLSDASYTVGGYLFTQDLSGVGIDLLIPHERVIIANGDVRLDENYNGPSLYILAGGQISQADGVDSITVDGVAVRSVTKTIMNGVDGLQSITVSTSKVPVIDIRSGFDWSAFNSNLLGNLNTSDIAVMFGGPENNGNIIAGKDIRIANIRNNGGEINLVAQRSIFTGDLDSSISPSTLNNATSQEGGTIFLLADSDIDVGSVNSFFLDTATATKARRDGGNIIFIAEGDIDAKSLTSGSLSFLSSGSEDLVGGDGGNIVLFAGNDINIDEAITLSGSDSFVGNVIGGDGGDVLLSAVRDINVINGEIVSFSGTNSFAGSDVVGGNGGDIVFSAGRDIVAKTLDSNTLSRAITFAGDVVGGNGGMITLSAGRDIMTQALTTNSTAISDTDLTTFTNSGNVTGGNGGVITLSAERDVVTGVFDSVSDSDSFSGDVVGGIGGTITVTAGGNITTDAIASVSDSDSFYFLGNVSGNNGGNITLTAGQEVITGTLTSISTSNAALFSSLGNVIGGNGGTIFVSAGNDIKTENINSFSLSESNTGNVTGGNGGTIFVSAGNDIKTENINSFSLSESNTGNVTGGNGGDINLRAERIDEVESSPTSSLLSFSIAEGGIKRRRR